MPWKAQWVWTGDDPALRNVVAYARKEFEVAGSLTRACLRITADSRYVLHLNGDEIGRGPVRSFPAHYSFDTYDLSGRLREGRNCIAVEVQHFGESTFQYILARPGLLAQLDLDYADGRPVTVGTDGTWGMILSPSHERRTPRISCQQAFEEQFDARLEPEGWQQAGYASDSWAAATVIGPAGCRPWGELSPRSIPFLSMDPLVPVRVVETRSVEQLPYHACVNFRTNLVHDVRDANRHDVAGCVVAEVESVEEITASLWIHPSVLPHEVRLGGRQVTCREGHYKLDLRAGSNLLLFDVSGHHHLFYLTTSIDSPSGLSFKWSTAGPFPSAEELRLSGVLEAASRSELDACGRRVLPVVGIDETVGHVYGRTTTQRSRQIARAIIQQADSLCAFSEDACRIVPGDAGEDVEVLLDFGREVVGYLEMELEAPAGTVFDLLGLEEMHGHERFYPGGLLCTLRYTSRPGHQVYRSIVRRGFRYLSVTVRDFSAPVVLRRIACYQNTYPVVEEGRFDCSDSLLSRIYSIGSYTTRLCSEDTFVDCPAYEQTFWVGDARNEALTCYSAFGAWPLSRRCLLLAAESLDRSPVTESQVPSGWEIVLTAWSLLWMIACDEYYLYSGDRTFVEEIYPALSKNVRGLRAASRDDGLLAIETWNMLDWAPMDTPDRGVITHNNAWWVRALRSTANLADVLGRNGDAVGYRALADRVRAGINAHLWSHDRRAYVDCLREDGQQSDVISQQTNTVVYLCDCAAPERESLIVPGIADAPDGWVEIGSPFMMFFAFEALTRLGRHQDILDLTRKNWGFMVRKGATTCWETFPHEGQDRWSRSLCHAWSAAPTYFLAAYQLGVRPIKPGFAEIVIEPHPGDLSWCEGAVPTPHGSVEVGWERSDDCFTMRVRVPNALSGRLRLPSAGLEGGVVKINGKAASDGDLPSPLSGPRVGEGYAEVSFSKGGEWEVSLSADG